MNRKYFWTKEQLFELYENQQLSADKISFILGTNKSQVLYWLHKYNFKLRPEKPFIKGHKTNVGSKKSLETRKKISIAHIGMKFSKKSKRKMSKSMRKTKCHAGKRNGMFGVHRFGKEAPGYINGITIKKHHCIDCGIEISLTGFKGTKRCNKCHGKAHRGINNTNFIDGRSHLDYPIEFNNDLKLKIRKRDSFKCLICGKSEEENRTKLSVHHIDYNKKNNKDKNLMCLCKSCHVNTNFNRDYWYAYCTYLMENK
jgi:hypothetical protein